LPAFLRLFCNLLMAERVGTYLLLLLGGAPLLVYPFVLLANVMSLAAEPTRVAKRWTRNELIAKAFLWTSTAYPIIFVPVCMNAIRAIQAGKIAIALELAAIPVVTLAIIAVLYKAWDKSQATNPRA